jgi:hypothetical protein
MRFQVHVHDPKNFPEVDAKGFAVGMANVAFIGVDADTTFRFVIRLLLGLSGKYMSSSAVGI